MGVLVPVLCPAHHDGATSQASGMSISILSIVHTQCKCLLCVRVQYVWDTNSFLSDSLSGYKT